MRAWRVGQPGPMRSGPLVADECPDPRPGPGEVLLRVRVCGVCRTDLHLAEGDLAAAAPRRHSGTRSRRRSHHVRGPRHAVLPRRPGGRRLARRDLRHLPLLPARRGEPLPLPRVHRLGPRRRLRRTHHGGRELRLPAPVELLGRGGRTPAVRGDHRLPRALPRRPAHRRTAGDLRLRRVRASGSPDRPLPGRPRVRDDPVRGSARPRPRAGGDLRRRRRRATAGSAGFRHPLRPGRQPGSGGPARPGPGRHARRRRHPPE